LGVTIGIFAIISVFTLVDSLERNVRDSMSFIGDKVMYVQKWPWSFSGNYPWWKYFQRPEASLQEFRFLDEHVTNDMGTAIFADKGGVTYKYRSNSYKDGQLFGVSYEYNQV